MTGGEVLLWTATIAVVLPIAVFVVECLAAQCPALEEVPLGERPPVVVLIPAHNEASGLSETLASLRTELRTGDEVLVVADNCTDDTAAIARREGATVLERINPGLRGKSYALDAGVRWLAERVSPPEIVIILDADTIASPGAIEELARTAHFYHQPVQGAYTLRPVGAQASAALASFAFTVRNVVRPQGLRCLGLPCLLNGSGMAFPWSILCRAALASGQLAEDRWLAVDLALAGHCTRFSPASITGTLPTAAKAVRTQRERWEHGHLETMLRQTPRLIVGAVRQRRVVLLALALELAVPPLSLLAIAWSVMLLSQGVILAWGGPWQPMLVLMATGVVWLGTLSMVRRRIGSSGGTAGDVGKYIGSKLAVYGTYLWKRQKLWIPTERDRLPDKHSSDGSV
jgi:cellulose synthase/poly-beta-1,6-N-acetylglucosamine synthase-like glycosyltransferase